MKVSFHFIKKLILVYLILVFPEVISQTKPSSQANMLRQYLGHWVSSEDFSSDSLAEVPNIKMTNIPKMNNASMTVEVLQFNGGKYKPILTELIGHDFITDSIIALGQNINGEMFIGKGVFLNEKSWVMDDFDLTGKKTMTVTFDFKHQTDVLLHGLNPDNEVLWKTRYIKKNPKNKNIGIQLVSVHEQMLENPGQTLQYLNRIGYSFVETFVYKNRTFYGLSPTDFKKLVEQYNMKFTGSMTFYNMPEQGKAWKDAMQWWSDCIDDHVAAGVEYLTISNTQLKDIDSLKELREYCNYYNVIGQLCKEKDIKFAYLNHSDEFSTIESELIYDYLIKNTDPEFVNFQADLYWMHFSGVNPVDYFNNYNNRFISWHVKDYQELGESGKMDFKSYFEHSESAGLSYIVAEVEAFNYPVWHSINLAWNYLYFKIL